MNYNEEGIKALQEERYEDAVKAFTEAIEQNPDDRWDPRRLRGGVIHVVTADRRGGSARATGARVRRTRRADRRSHATHR